jgi:hypothetical protein
VYVYLHNMEQLTLHMGLEVSLDFLNDELWAMTCLDSLALCLLALCLSYYLLWHFYNPINVGIFWLTSHSNYKDLGSNLSSLNVVKK